MFSNSMRREDRLAGSLPRATSATASSIEVHGAVQLFRPAIVPSDRDRHSRAARSGPHHIAHPCSDLAIECRRRIEYKSVVVEPAIPVYVAQHTRCVPHTGLDPTKERSNDPRAQRIGCARRENVSRGKGRRASYDLARIASTHPVRSAAFLRGVHQRVAECQGFPSNDPVLGTLGQHEAITVVSRMAVPSSPRNPAAACASSHPSWTSMR